MCCSVRRRKRKKKKRRFKHEEHEEKTRRARRIMDQYRVPVDRFTTSIKPWQLEAFRAFDSGNRFLVQRWHRRARKTTADLNLIIRECIRVPGYLYCVACPTKEQAKKIYWLDTQMLQAYLPDKSAVPWKENKTDKVIIFGNGSRLLFTGVDEPDSLRGPKFKGVVLDEYAFHELDAWKSILQPTIEEDPNAWVMFASTPNGDNHFKKIWDDAENKSGWWRSVVRASETDIFTKETLARLKEDTPRAIYDQEYECSFITEEERALITSFDLDALAGMYREPDTVRKFISVDPSLGYDECVIYVWRNGRIIDSLILHERDEMRIVATIVLLAKKHDIMNIGGDVIGIGAGIFSRLSELGYHTYPINSAESSSQPEKWANKRAECWWKAWECVKNKLVEYPTDAKLRKQLTNVHFRPVRGPMMMEDKEITRKRLEESPDRADDFVYGCYMLTIISPEPIRKDEGDERLRNRARRNAMAA